MLAITGADPVSHPVPRGKDESSHFPDGKTLKLKDLSEAESGSRVGLSVECFSRRGHPQNPGRRNPAGRERVLTGSSWNAEILVVVVTLVVWRVEFTAALPCAGPLRKDTQPCTRGHRVPALRGFSGREKQVEPAAPTRGIFIFRLN